MHRVQLEFSEAPITAESRITIDADSSCARKLANLKLLEVAENDDNGIARLGMALHLWMATFAARLRKGPPLLAIAKSMQRLCLCTRMCYPRLPMPLHMLLH